MNDTTDQPSREFIAQHIAGSGRPAGSLDPVFDAAFEQGSPGSSDPEKYVRKILHRAKEIERERMAAEVRIKAGRAFHVELLGPDRRILRLRTWPSESIDTVELDAALELIDDPEFKAQMTNRGFKKVIVEFIDPDSEKKRKRRNLRLHPETTVETGWAREFPAEALYQAFLTLAYHPQVVFRGGRDSHWHIDVQGLRHVRSVLTDDILAAFLKCFVSIDRLRMIESLVPYGKLNTLNGPGGHRKAMTTYILKLSSLYELKVSISDLRTSLMKGHLGDRVDRSLLKQLSDINKQLEKPPLGGLIKTIRNHAGHHFGELDVYKRGLAKYQAPDLKLYEVGDDDVFDNFFVGTLEVLLDGLADGADSLTMEPGEALSAVRDLEHGLHKVLMELFMHTLSLCNVLVVDQRTE